MQNYTLDSGDFDVLFEALDAWVSKDAAGHIIATVVASVISGPDNEARDRSDAVLAKQEAEMEQKKTIRKERAVLLQAKLLQLRDAQIAESAME